MTSDMAANIKGENLRVSWREAAAFLRQAAHFLRTYGYSAFPENEGESGYSLGMVLCLSTRCTDSPAEASQNPGHTVICDEVRRRLVGYLYLTGDAITTHHGGSLADEIEWWERNPPYVDRDKIVAALSASAAILEENIDMYAKIRRPPAQPEILS